MVILDLFVSN